MTRATPKSPRPTPLIVLLHGLGSSADDIVSVTDLPERAADKGAAVVVPDATGTPTLWQMGAEGTDVAFIDALLNEISTTYCIDLARVSFAAFSAGAAFAISYACAHQSQVAALLTVAVEFAGACTRPMPITAIHGTDDPIVAYGDTPDSGTRKNMASWAETSRCAPEPTTKQIADNVTRTTWTACAEQSAVVLYTITSGGHTWPRASADAVDATSRQFDATNAALRFLKQHRIPKPSKFCKQARELLELIEGVPPSDQPNLAASTRIVNVQQQALDTAPDAALRDAITHSTDAVFAITEGRAPTEAESSSASEAVQALTTAC